MTVLASGSKGNSTVISSSKTCILVDAGLSCRELLRRMAIAGEDPASLDAILITHEHIDHVAGLAVLARRLNIPVFFTEPTHRAWVRMLTPRTSMTYAKWLDHVQQEKAARANVAALNMTPNAPSAQDAPSSAVSSQRVGCDEAEAIATISAQAVACADLRSDDPNAPLELPIDPDADLEAAYDSEEPVFSLPKEKVNPAHLPAVEYFHAGTHFSIGDLVITPFTIPHDAADPCGFVFESRSEAIRMAIATDLGYMPPNVKAALKCIDVLLLESNHDLEMLRDGPYPWSVKQRVLSRVGHLSNHATAEFLAQDYDGGAAYIVLGHLSEANNAPELALLSAEQAIGNRLTLLGNRILLARQSTPLDAITL